MAKKPDRKEVVVKRVETTIFERPNGTKARRQLTDTLELRPPEKPYRLSGWPLVFLIIFLAVLGAAIVIGSVAVGLEDVYEFLKDCLEQLIEQFPSGS